MKGPPSLWDFLIQVWLWCLLISHTHRRTEVTHNLLDCFWALVEMDVICNCPVYFSSRLIEGFMGTKVRILLRMNGSGKGMLLTVEQPGLCSPGHLCPRMTYLASSWFKSMLIVGLGFLPTQKRCWEARIDLGSPFPPFLHHSDLGQITPTLINLSFFVYKIRIKMASTSIEQLWRLKGHFNNKIITQLKKTQ